jgi:hypothetical protein
MRYASPTHGRCASYEAASSAESGGFWLREVPKCRESGGFKPAHPALSEGAGDRLRPQTRDGMAVEVDHFLLRLPRGRS